jgi:hypothetical protein
MANRSLSDFTSLINQEIIIKEKLHACLSKADALLDVGMNTNLFELSKPTIYGYFWALHDLMGESLKLNDEALHILSQFK